MFVGIACFESLTGSGSYTNDDTSRQHDFCFMFDWQNFKLKIKCSYYMITRLDSKLGNVNVFGDDTDQHCRIFYSQFIRLSVLFSQFIILG